MGIVRTLTGPLSTRLTTEAAVRDELEVDFHPRLGGLVDQASSACADYCGRPFGRATYAEDFQGHQPIILSRLPVTAVASVTYDGTLMPQADWWHDPATGALSWLGTDLRWYSTNRLIRTTVEYTAGWLLPGDDGRDLPHSVERACLEMVKMLWFGSGNAARDPSIRSENIAGIGSTTFQTAEFGSFGLPMSAVELLSPYRRMRI